MFDNPHFASLVEAGQSTGEVVGINRFLVTVRGLGSISVNAMVYFANGHQGMVREVDQEVVIVLNLTAESIPLGTLAVLESDQLVTGVGEALIGRIISPLGKPIDGKGPIALTETGIVFSEAPGIIARKQLDEQLVTGVTIVDSLFAFALGQRIAVLGDSKTGKSSFAFQMTLSQKGTNRIIVYCLIAKKKTDIDKLVTRLNSSGIIDQCILVVSSVFDSLTQSYLAPYVAVTVAEHLWFKGRDVIIIYDDLSNHAKVYRELALLLKVAPGRESYPGDIFYAHSSLLERAGRLKSTGATLSSLPIVLTPSDDITTFLPTAIMSITDGQIIFDAKTFRKNIRPAANVGLSVSRVGGRAQNSRQKKITGLVNKTLAAYRQADEFSHFGSELAVESRAVLELGKRLYEGLRQGIEEVFDANQQILILEVIMRTEGKIKINVDALKQKVKIVSSKINQDGDFEPLIAQLLAETTIQTAPVAVPEAAK